MYLLHRPNKYFDLRFYLYDLIYVKASSSEMGRNSMAAMQESFDFMIAIVSIICRYVKCDVV
jgi:hypothetical protein